MACASSVCSISEKYPIPRSTTTRIKQISITVSSVRTAPETINMKSACNISMAGREAPCRSSRALPQNSCNPKDEFAPDKPGGCKARNTRDPLSMSVEMPDCIQPTEIDSAFVSVKRPQDEILWGVGKVVQDFHKRNHFHDAVVKAVNGEVLAHRYVLAASSEWMKDTVFSQRDERCAANTFR